MYFFFRETFDDGSTYQPRDCKIFTSVAEYSPYYANQIFTIDSSVTLADSGVAQGGEWEGQVRLGFW